MKKYGLIIGCSKSGTTSLYQYLTQHPQISACREKEPNFFASDEHWERGMDWYRGLWPPDAGPVLMEATTLYTWTPMLPNAAERIASVTDAVKESSKFVYIMRDPIRRAESQIRFSAGRDRLHLLTLEALKENPQQELERVCEFLGSGQSHSTWKLSTTRRKRKP